MSRRRAVLGGVAALLASPLALAAPGVQPDAELIEVCRAFVAGSAAYDRVYDTVSDDAEAAGQAAPLVEALEAQLDRMERLQARTPAGIQSRALALHRHAERGDTSFDDPGTYAGRLLGYLLRDATALTNAI